MSGTGIDPMIFDQESPGPLQASVSDRDVKLAQAPEAPCGREGEDGSEFSLVG